MAKPKFDDLREDARVLGERYRAGFAMILNASADSPEYEGLYRYGKQLRREVVDFETLAFNSLASDQAHAVREVLHSAMEVPR